MGPAILAAKGPAKPVAVAVGVADRWGATFMRCLTYKLMPSGETQLGDQLWHQLGQALRDPLCSQLRAQWNLVQKQLFITKQKDN